MTTFLVFAYVFAAFVSNLVIARFGPSAAIPVAFFCIGLNITVRDKLHDFWQGPRLALRMMLLIYTGAALSYAATPAAGRIGLASMIAFGLSETVDAWIYQKLHYKRWFIRSNFSNVGAALVDSVLFITIAFASLLPWLVLLQFGAKVTGGFLWSLVLKRKERRCHVCDGDEYPCLECAIGAIHD